MGLYEMMGDILSLQYGGSLFHCMEVIGKIKLLPTIEMNRSENPDSEVWQGRNGARQDEATSKGKKERLRRAAEECRRLYYSILFVFGWETWNKDVEIPIRVESLGAKANEKRDVRAALSLVKELVGNPVVFVALAQQDRYSQSYTLWKN
ncbi:hypothetical protein MKW98_014212 [Papaver atlanticum]|uniref:Uncharacterized protein n=1 Tax=Papaver atlanticum TaxID=357466 RepID=A0AAD4SJG6_9MAGN|nr:hypothetical protein MKW98_014212 [Papaver atlanticum]